MPLLLEEVRDDALDNRHKPSTTPTPDSKAALRSLGAALGPIRDNAGNPKLALLVSRSFLLARCLLCC